MALVISWPFPAHACTDEDVNVSHRVRIAVVSGQFRGEAVQIGVIERSGIGETRE